MELSPNAGPVDRLIPEYTIPSTVTSLVLVGFPNIPADRIPASVVYLDLGSNLERIIERDTLPPSIKQLRLGSNQVTILARDSLPSSITALEFSGFKIKSDNCSCEFGLRIGMFQRLFHLVLGLIKLVKFVIVFYDLDIHIRPLSPQHSLVLVSGMHGGFVHNSMLLENQALIARLISAIPFTLKR
ncbi:hypothetical protein SAMD00019534_052910 [Acytostelium subglobosum LB1]|uniref:hypothetical protein n=1 Tax=Acytostelium subglobosum LB1 TaxID=1410327 RepID=UPI0006451DF6|nr:hypothetical protein SAMD00019534_052910 [Acytostelium subglobosum LB1]GAM22116.1 hypothetical protein SAMD00019534_052910 [Acytostelium subglobosum LB1]|eukprot:XP_012755216.1 hypothetical protein SAMD00019534_052910 [Acytostelium subglobosum LB1]